MQYNILKSIVASQKKPRELAYPSDSFFVKSKRINPYIEPGFSKSVFPHEKPSILLVSAVGASGKTTTAHVLSFDTELPILDLAKHKSVGDHTLTGVLTTAYATEHRSAVLDGLREGTHGVIIDGIDEGRSKTTGQGFEAFLDDLIQLSQGSPNTTVVIFGRNPVLFGAWMYLEDRKANVGMIEIDPFTQKQARDYIDRQVSQSIIAGQQGTYEQARDGVLTKLSGAFAPARTDDGNNANMFLSFIGYPPVLDAIVTLLRQNPNYHLIHQSLIDEAQGQLETDILIAISDYLLDRDYEEKALPNFIEGIAENVGGTLGQQLRTSLYSREEQCARVLSRALDRPFPRRIIEDNTLNEQYETAVELWCKGHPFLEDEFVRNGVFVALAVARCTLSNVSEYRELARDYAAANRPTYHLLYILAELANKENCEIDARSFNMLIQSCSEFLGINADISVHIYGSSWEESETNSDKGADLTIAIEFPDKEQERTFSLKGVICSESIPLGPYLINTSVVLPCAVNLVGSTGFEANGVCSISAEHVEISTPDLILRGISRQNQDDEQGHATLLINTRKATGGVKTVSFGTGEFEIQCAEHELGYPLRRYAHVQNMPLPSGDALFRKKYLRLRRILSDFASHKKGGLAKYRRKIDHERVLQGNLGQNILAALLQQSVLWKDSTHYHLNPDRYDKVIGFSWPQLRQNQSSNKLEQFLKPIS